MNTYATLTELNRMYSSAVDYSNDSQLQAQSMSYDLVNSFLDSQLVIPSAQTSTAPGILKMAQGKFYQYLLESSNIGYTDELQQIFKATSELLSKITQNELGVPNTYFKLHDVGFNIVSNTSADGRVWLYKYNTPPQYPVTYTLKITTGGDIRSGLVVYDVYRGDSLTSALVTHQNATYFYQNVFYGKNLSIYVDNFSLLFDGTWVKDDEIVICGVPQAEINAVEKTDTLKQGLVWY